MAERLEDQTEYLESKATEILDTFDSVATAATKAVNEYAPPKREITAGDDAYTAAALLNQRIGSANKRLAMT